MKRATFIVSVGLLALALQPARALAWGNEGHRIVCQIAFERLTPKAKALVTAIFADRPSVNDPFAGCTSCGDHKDDGRFMTFQEGCTWPDASRRDTFKDTYEFHFINVPRGATTLDLVRDCAALDCVLVGIQRNARYIATAPSSSAREKERRVLALRFLSHFVGDLHQPLHLGFIEDAGGNLITVQWDTGPATVPKKLHEVWDTAVMQRAGIATDADGTVLNNQITAAELAAWETFDITSWAQESFAFALSHAYRQPNGNPVIAGSVLGDDYFNAARPVVIERLKQAGVRLAHLINAAADGTLPTRLLELNTK
jgi:hypothetical protein